MFKQLTICISLFFGCSAFTCPFPNGNFPDAADIHKYYLCADGVAYEQICPGVLVFDNILRSCVKEVVYTTIVTLAPTAAPTAAPTTRTPGVVSCADCKGSCYYVDPNDSHYFYECDHDRLAGRLQCQSPLIYDPTVHACNYAHDHRDTLCPQDNGLFKDPLDVHKFVLCNDGHAYELQCPGTLVFDGTACTWP